MIRQSPMGQVVKRVVPALRPNQNIVVTDQKIIRKADEILIAPKP